MQLMQHEHAALHNRPRMQSGVVYLDSAAAQILGIGPIQKDIL